VTELAANGELFDLVSTADNLNGDKMKYARFIFKQIADAFSTYT